MSVWLLLTLFLMLVINLELWRLSTRVVSLERALNDLLQRPSQLDVRIDLPRDPAPDVVFDVHQPKKF